MRPFEAMRLRSASSLPSPDPTFSNILLLIHGDARPFMDSGPNANPVCNNAARLTLSSGAISCGASNSGDALRVPALGAFGTAAWCLAGYVYGSIGSTIRLFDWRINTSTPALAPTLAINTSGYPYLSVSGTNYGLGGTGLPAANLSILNNTRTHVAMSYDGTTLRCFVGGALSWSHSVSFNLTDNNGLTILNTGNLTDSTGGVRLDELLIVKGEALYTSAFAPPTRYTDTGTVIASAPAPTFSNVKLLVHGSSLSNGATSFTDTSASGRTVSVFGNAQATTAQYRIGTSSIDFDGTGDYLTVPSSSDFAFGTGDYCIEGQFRSTVTTRRCMLATYLNTSDGWTLQQSITTAQDVYFNETGDGVDIGGKGVALTTQNAWAHIAVGRYGSLLMLFIEGELVDIKTDSQSITNAVALYFGRLTTVSTSYDWTGQMQEIRVCKGVMPYVRSFIVQTAAHPDS